MSESTTKLKLLKILEILRKESDDEHYVETGEILRQLEQAGIHCQRRVLYGDNKEVAVINTKGNIPQNGDIPIV